MNSASSIDAPPDASQPSAVPTDGLIALLILYVLWGSTYLGIKFALISFPPFLLGGTRLPAAGLVMYLFLRLRGTPNPTRRQWLHCIIYGVLLLGVGNGILAFAEQYISSSLAAALLAAQPVVIVLVFGLFGKWPRKLEWLGIAVGIVGVVLLNLDGELLANPLGVVALLVSMLGWSFGTVLAREKLDLPGGAMTTSVELLAGGFFQLLISTLLHEQMKPLQAPAMAGWAYLAVVSIIGFTSYTIVIRRLRPTLASSFSYVNPAVALVLGALIGGERVSTIAIVGVAVIILGVLFISLAQRKR